MSQRKQIRDLLHFWQARRRDKRMLDKALIRGFYEPELVPSARNKPMHNARKTSKIKTLGERLLKVKGVKFQRQNDTKLSDNENKDEGLYNEQKAWNLASGS